MALGPDVSVKNPDAAQDDVNKMAQLATGMHGRLEVLLNQVNAKLSETEGSTKDAFLVQLTDYRKMAMELEDTKNRLAAAAQSIIASNVSDDIRYAKAFESTNYS
jgi:hypothetical protein